MAIGNAALLRLLASIDPRLWEVLFPPQPPWVGHSVVPQPWLRSGPSPVPWGTQSSDFQLQVQIAARDLARRIVEAAAAVSAQGGDGAAVIKRSVEEWVQVDDSDGDGDGTGKVPLTHFFPPLWPFDPPRPPRPNELVELIPAFVAAAWSFSTLAETIRDPSLNQAIDAAVAATLDRAARPL